MISGNQRRSVCGSHNPTEADHQQRHSPANRPVSTLWTRSVATTTLRTDSGPSSSGSAAAGHHHSGRQVRAGLKDPLPAGRGKHRQADLGGPAGDRGASLIPTARHQQHDRQQRHRRGHPQHPRQPSEQDGGPEHDRRRAQRDMAPGEADDQRRRRPTPPPRPYAACGAPNGPGTASAAATAAAAAPISRNASANNSSAAEVLDARRDRATGAAAARR